MSFNIKTFINKFVKKKWILFLLLLLLVLITFLTINTKNKRSTEYLFYKKGKNKIFVYKKLNSSIIFKNKKVKQFIKDYDLYTNKFFNINNLYKNFDILNENLIIFLLKNNFLDLKPKDHLIIEKLNLNKPENKYILYSYLRISFSKMPDITGLFDKRTKTIFLVKSNSSFENILISEINHFLIDKNFINKDKKNKITYNDSLNETIVFFDETITEFIGTYLFVNKKLLINNKGINIFISFIKKYSKLNNLKHDNITIEHLLNFDVSEELHYLLMHSFLIYVIKKYGFFKLKKLIKAFYIKKYKNINEVINYVFGTDIENLVKDWKNYHRSIYNKF